MTDLIRTTLQAPEDARKGLGNCGVFALAVASGSSEQYVWDWLRGKGKGRSGNWKGSTTTKNQAQFLQAHGIQTEAVALPATSTAMARNAVPYARQAVLHGINASPAPKRLTAARLARCPEFQDGSVYLVWTTGHIQLMYKGRLMDQNSAGLVAPSEYRLARKEVKMVARLVNVTTEPVAPAEPKAPRKRKAPVAQDWSTIDSPCARAWALYDHLLEQGWELKCAPYAEQAMALGVSKNTAKTQFYHWRKARGL